MKLLIVQNYWTPYRNYLFSALAAEPDIDLEVLYLGQVGADRKWTQEHTVFHTIQASSKKRGPFVCSKLKKIDFEKYDAIVTLEHLENIFSILHIAKQSRGKYILWSGMFDDMYPDKPFYGRCVELVKRLYRPFLYRAQHYLAYSSLTKAMFLKNGVQAQNITVMPQVAKVDRIPELENTALEKLRTGRAGPLQVLSLGYLRPEKNNLLLARVCGRFSDDELQLTIIGDGPQRDVLNKFNSENVTLSDYMEGEKKGRAYLAADLFVLPTVRDPWGLVVNEAMWYGLPILCSERAGARDAIDGNGFVFDPYNEDELCNHLDYFVKNREKIGEMGRRSREVVETRYSAAEAVATFRKVFKAAGVL